MPRASWLQTSFNGGEWSPLAQGRIDLAKYKNGLALCQNYVPLVQGPLTRRPGTRYVAEVKDSAKPVRLVKFEFSVTQAYVLEFGQGYIRFFTNDGQLLSSGTPYEIVAPYAAIDPSELWGLSFAQSADVLYIAHPKYPPAKLKRMGATNWTLTNISFLDGPYLPLNVTSTTMSIAGSSGTVTVTASSITGINDDTGFQSTDVGRMLRIRSGTTWLWGTISVVHSTTSVDWAISVPTGPLIPSTATGSANISGGAVISVTLTSPGGGYSFAPTVSFSGGGGSGATGYATVVSGVVTSIVITSGGSGYTSAPTVTIAAPSGTSGTTPFWRMGVWTGPANYPTCVAFNQDRLVWAGAPNFPSRIDGSCVSDYENMQPAQADGTVIDSNAISFSLNSSTMNVIRWMVSDEWGLLCGTAGGEWVVTPSNLQQAITPTNINAKQSTSYGVAAIEPIRVGKSTLYIQRTGRKLREMTYQYVVNTFQAPDISLVSEHLTKGGIKQICFTLAPYQQLWMCRNDGTLIGVSYDKDQECVGWHQHQLGGDGIAESVASMPAPDVTRDELWLVVRRTINGNTKRYVEVMTKFWEDGDSVEDSAFLDSSAAYSGAPTATISGLTWLEGKTVSVLADGSTHPDRTVSGGAITLQRAASTVQVGFKYSSKGKTLRIEAGGADGPAQGKLKRIHRAVFRFFQTVGQTLSGANGSIPEPFRDSSMPMDQPVALFTGDKRWAYEGSYDTDGQISWEQDDPLPSNITMLSAQLETQDGG